METTLNALQYLGVVPQGSENLRIGLLDQPNRLREALRPMRESGAMMGCSEKHNPSSAVENLLEMLLGSILGRCQRLEC